MGDAFEFDVFLSHSSKDKEAVRAIAERLRADGLKVWFDEWVLKPGDNIPAKTEQGLEQSRMLVLCMSRNAFGPDWPRLESQTLRFRDPLNKERRFVSLRMDDAYPKDALLQFIYIDWREAYQERAIAELREACGLVSRSSSEGGELRPEEVKCRTLSLGHTHPVRSVALSADGLRVLSGSVDGTVRLWDVESGCCLRVLEGHSNGVFSVAWSGDDHRAVSGSADKTVRLWDVEDGRCLRVLAGFDGTVMSVAWCGDGRRVLCGSDDSAVRLWDVERGECLQVLKGHSGSVWSVTWSNDGRLALSGSTDNTVRLWDVEAGCCLRVLEGHSDHVSGVAWSADGRCALSGSYDKTVRLWDVETGDCLRVFEGHPCRVLGVTWTNRGDRALSGSVEGALRLWDAESGRCLRVFEGLASDFGSMTWSADGQRALCASEDAVRLWHVESDRCVRLFEARTTGTVRSVAWSGDGRRALSGSDDQTVRLWDVESGRCLRVLEGHSARVWSVGWSGDGRRALSGSADQTVRLWDVESGRCLRVLEGHSARVLSVVWSGDGRIARSGAINGVWREWDLTQLVGASESAAEFAARAVVAGPDQVQYTNAKVLLVGDTSSGKTGLAHRLATGKWKPTDGSTVGAWCTQWALSDAVQAANLNREIWLWDFGGQADQRLIHQLFMDRAALILLLFDADKEDVLPGLRDWQAALRRCVAAGTPQLLVAGRVDAGLKASRGKLQEFARENGFDYFETSAKEGTGCDELVRAMKDGISWEQIEKRTSPRTFKVIKDEILKLRDEGQVLHTFKELRGELSRRLTEEERFGDEVLQAVIGLLDGPGAVKELDYGTYVLLQPEWINIYAQAVVRTLRDDPKELGSLPLRSIAEGKLLFQSVGSDGAIVKAKRLPQAQERVVLREMERQLEERGLCFRQGDKLVFPSHCGRDRPAVQEHPSIFVSYRVKGYLDEIYATLAVKLADSQAFKLNQLWRDAADFTTLRGERHMGIKLMREAAEAGDISVYFGTGVAPQEQAIFANYIHAHLVGKCEEVLRLRHYACPLCNTPKGNPQALMKKLLDKGREAMVVCDACDESFGLWDELEMLFASDEVRRQVEGLQAVDAIRLDARRKGKLLALEVQARIASADQKSFEIPAPEDEGIDIELEFTDDEGKGTGKRLYLQLKSGNSHLEKRKDGTEVFRIREQRWVEYWLKQPCPVMLVVGTFAEDEERGLRREKLEFADVRWMEISSALREASEGGTQPITQIEFKGERLDLTSVRRWRERLLRSGE